MMRKWEIESGATPGHLKVTRTCPTTGDEHSIEVPTEGFSRWQSGTLIQKALPNLSVSDREFLISGITPATWNKIFD